MSEETNTTEETTEKKSRMSKVTKRNLEETQKKTSQSRLSIIKGSAEEDRKTLSTGNGTVDYRTGKIVRI
jgi:hypothetical protein